MLRLKKNKASMLLNGAGTGAAWVIMVTLPAMPELAKTEVSGSQGPSAMPIG
jgi:hypothetical protein